MRVRRMFWSLLALAVLLPGGQARAETWCIRDAGSPPPGACVFPSAHDCGQAATLNPLGGVCERQPLAGDERAGGKTAPARRSARRKSARYP
jgi:hypothetical protein